MCGISGIFHKNQQPVDRSVLEKMNRTMAHRGPDAEGYFLSGPVGLGHRRLSIIDLSSGGQPMSTADGRYTIVFNGEIYNYQNLRDELSHAGVVFTTHSDTEVLLYAYAHQREKCLSKLNGMFCFAIWDAAEQTLFIARDRMGKKPLYYWNSESQFSFASECKAFRPLPNFRPELDQVALAHFFQYEYIPAPHCIFEGVKKLPAAHYLTVKAGQVLVQSYWDVPLGRATEDVDPQQAQSRLIQLLDEAVDRRLMSDVPLGVFLSGGVDSSTVVALMARHREGKDIKTFSVNFNEKSFDESEYSNLIAKKFGTDHYQETLDPHRMIDILPEVCGFLDEPFADYSVIPTYLLSRFTRQKVTVALGGDGGDELFCGYPTFAAGQWAQSYSQAPSFLRNALNFVVNHLPVSDKDMSLDFKAKQFIYGAAFPPVLRNQVWLGAFHRKEMRDLFLPDTKAATFLATHDPLDRVTEVMRNCPTKHPGERMLYFYQKFYLCDDILVKADRASMAASLEVRAPFLDVNVVEYAASLPYNLKLKGKHTKYILKKSIESLLPHDIIYRPKKGFGIPIAIWLRNELKDEMRRALDPSKIAKEGIFKPSAVTKLVEDHLARKKNNRKQLFSLLMFEWWRERYL